jgi:hypothetical protein
MRAIHGIPNKIGVGNYAMAIIELTDGYIGVAGQVIPSSAVNLTYYPKTLWETMLPPDNKLIRLD